MLILDRFEEEYAVCELSTDGQEEAYIQIPVVSLPENAQEGDCLYQDSEGEWQIDSALTAKRRQEIREKLANLLGCFDSL